MRVSPQVLGNTLGSGPMFAFKCRPGFEQIPERGHQALYIPRLPYSSAALQPRVMVTRVFTGELHISAGSGWYMELNISFV